MTKEAELKRDSEDKKRRDAVEARNQLDSSIYQLEKTLKESGRQAARRQEDQGRGRPRRGEEGP